jgi:hypothetical protein
MLQPTNLVAVVGADVTFQVEATGNPAPSYQWFFQATKLVDGATGNILTLTNVQPAQSGVYYAVAVNSAGSATSMVAILRALLQPALVASAVVIAEDRVSVSVPSVDGLNYTLEFTESLEGSLWTPIEPPMPGTGGIIILMDTAPPVGNRFYRVRCE